MSIPKMDIYKYIDRFGGIVHSELVDELHDGLNDGLRIMLYRRITTELNIDLELAIYDSFKAARRIALENQS